MNERLPNLADIYSLQALYSPTDLSSFDDDEALGYINKIKETEEGIDLYCIECERHSTFRSLPLEIGNLVQKDKEQNQNNYFGTTLTCARDSEHHIVSFFHYKQKTLTKIGQLPSIADIGIASKVKYRKILGQNTYRDLTKAIGLKAHGIGIGSYIYLRRIFENLIEDAHKNAQLATDWKDDEFQKSRMDEKIDLLKFFLPEFLVENRGIYSILSKGVHALNEDECLQHFDILLIGIEIILDQKIEALQKESRVQEAKKAINDLKAKLV